MHWVLQTVFKLLTVPRHSHVTLAKFWTKKTQTVQGLLELLPPPGQLFPMAFGWDKDGSQERQTPWPPYNRHT